MNVFNVWKLRLVSFNCFFVLYMLNVVFEAVVS